MADNVLGGLNVGVNVARGGPKPVLDQLDETLQLAFEAGWDPKYGPPPFRHGRFVEGLVHSFDPNTLLDVLGNVVPK